MLSHLLTFIIFFTIGQELRVGITHSRDAYLPLISAVGGMLVPALLIHLLQRDFPGWAVVMPTDVVLAIGALALAGKRVRPSVRIFLMTLAIGDDFFTLLVMGIFYRHDLDFVGAFTTLGAAFFGAVVSLSKTLNTAVEKCANYFAIPLYILLNLFTGLQLNSADFSLSSSIIASRIIGKVMGISLFAFIAMRLLKIRPRYDISIYEITGVGFFAGMGMTVSLVIAEISIHNNAVISQVKAGLLVSAFISALLGLAWFKRFPGDVFLIDEIRNIQ